MVRIDRTKRKVVLLALALWLMPTAQVHSQIRRTALGEQQNFAREAAGDDAEQVQQRKNETGAVDSPIESLDDVMERALNAHGGRQILKDLVDVFAEGVFRQFSTSGESRDFPFTLTGKGDTQVQRVIQETGSELRHGTDGTQTWQSVNGHYAQAGGPNGAFLELETVRSVLRFLDYQNRGLKLKDRGMRASRRAVEAEDADGRVTTYSLEPDGRVSRLEFLDGQSINMLTGQPIPLVQSYEFSGHRVIQGVLTPMKIELFINGLRSDSMELSSVRYNSAIPDSQFRP